VRSAPRLADDRQVSIRRRYRDHELRASPEHQIFGQALARGGYRTTYIGKWHLWANELSHDGESAAATFLHYREPSQSSRKQRNDAFEVAHGIATI
jgi:arylsulfatase A-like enzyme